MSIFLICSASGRRWDLRHDQAPEVKSGRVVIFSRSGDVNVPPDLRCEFKGCQLPGNANEVFSRPLAPRVGPRVPCASVVVRKSCWEPDLVFEKGVMEKPAAGKFLFQLDVVQ